MDTADALAMEVDKQLGLTALVEKWNSGNPARGSVGSYRDLEEALRIDAARWKSFRERVKAARERAIDLREALRVMLVPRIEASHGRAVRRAVEEWASIIAGGGPEKAGLSRGLVDEKTWIDFCVANIRSPIVVSPRGTRCMSERRKLPLMRRALQGRSADAVAAGWIDPRAGDAANTIRIVAGRGEYDPSVAEIRRIASTPIEHYLRRDRLKLV